MPPVCFVRPGALVIVPCNAAFALRLGEYLRVTGLIDMSLGQTAHGVLVVAAGVGGVQDIHYVQLGKAGGHGAVAEQTLVGGHIQHMVGQLCHLGGVTAITGAPPAFISLMHWIISMVCPE